MESSQQPTITSIKNTIISVGIIMGVILYALPYLIKGYHENRLEKLKEHDIVAPEVISIQAVVDPILEEADLGKRLAEHRAKDSYFAVFQSSNPIKTAKLLKSMLDEDDVETYLSVLDGFDAAIRIYAGAHLTHHLLFSPPPPLIETGYPERPLRERPQLAIIIGLLGERDLNSVTQHSMPLSIGICPFQPFSMRLAEASAQNYHEVLSDLRCDDSTEHSGLLAIPYTSGSIYSQVQLPHSGIPKAVQVKPADGSSPPSDNNMHVTAQFAPHRSAMDSLARALSLSRELGIGALLINADDPELDSVLAWSTGASKLGYRLVFASELGRFQTLVGPKNNNIELD
jgi:hypothetical protein